MVILILLVESEYPSHVRCSVDTGCGSTEHLLHQVVSFLWFLARHDFARVYVDLLPDHQFNYTDHLG